MERKRLPIICLLLVLVLGIGAASGITIYDNGLFERPGSILSSGDGLYALEERPDGSWLFGVDAGSNVTLLENLSHYQGGACGLSYASGDGHGLFVLMQRQEDPGTPMQFSVIRFPDGGQDPIQSSWFSLDGATGAYGISFENETFYIPAKATEAGRILCFQIAPSRIFSAASDGSPISFPLYMEERAPENQLVSKAAYEGGKIVYETDTGELSLQGTDDSLYRNFQQKKTSFLQKLQLHRRLCLYGFAAILGCIVLFLLIHIALQRRSIRMDFFLLGEGILLAVFAACLVFVQSSGKSLEREALARYVYLGFSEIFAGEEAVWKKGKAQYAMNYLGRVLEKEFSGNFLKEALRAADKKMPYRGPEYYQSGEYTYKCSVNGDFTWFQGYEEIYWHDKKVYECFFHGGVMK